MWIVRRTRPCERLVAIETIAAAVMENESTASDQSESVHV